MTAPSHMDLKMEVDQESDGGMTDISKTSNESAWPANRAEEVYGDAHSDIEYEFKHSREGNAEVSRQERILADIQKDMYRHQAMLTKAREARDRASARARSIQIARLAVRHQGPSIRNARRGSRHRRHQPQVALRHLG